MGVHALYRNNNLKKFISRSLMPKGDLLENTLVLRVEIPPIQTLHCKSLRHQTRRQWKVRGLKEWMTEATVFSVWSGDQNFCLPFSLSFSQELQFKKGFLDNSVGKESTCIAGDPGLTPGLERSAGEGIGYPFKNSWASFVAQLVKNPPAIRETWVRSLSWEDPLGEGKGYPLQYSGLVNFMDCVVQEL